MLLSLRTLRQCDPDAAIAALHRWAEVWRAVDRSELPVAGDHAVRTFCWYLLHVTEVDPKRLRTTLEAILQRPEVSIMSTATKLREEGRVATLRRLLMKRFGPLPHATEQRLELATPEQLDRYTDRVLDAATLADVFAEPQG